MLLFALSRDPSIGAAGGLGGREEEGGGDEKGLLRRDSRGVFDHSFHFLLFSVRFRFPRIQFRFKHILMIIPYPTPHNFRRRFLLGVSRNVLHKPFWRPNVSEGLNCQEISSPLTSIPRPPRFLPSPIIPFKFNSVRVAFGWVGGKPWCVRLRTNNYSTEIVGSTQVVRKGGGGAKANDFSLLFAISWKRKTTLQINFVQRERKNQLNFSRSPLSFLCLRIDFFLLFHLGKFFLVNPFKFQSKMCTMFL